MASVSASHFVSRASAINSHGTSGSEDKKNLAQVGLRSQTVTHNGLRSVNTLDMLQMKSSAKVVYRKALKKDSVTENDRPNGKIICGSGMNMIFVGCEVAPWSKTGGLGDVLGGLPPAMAVSQDVLLLDFRPSFLVTIYLFVVLFDQLGSNIGYLG